MRRWTGMLVLALLAACGQPDIERPVDGAPIPDIQVLDGDTVVFEGTLYKIAGIDAPELGPWATCWAEAVLAGPAKDAVERELVVIRPTHRWRVTGASAPDAKGLRTAHFTRDDGEDLADLLVVGGYAARTQGRWKWCEETVVRDHLSGEPPPHGPSLWYPSGDVRDDRADD